MIVLRGREGEVEVGIATDSFFTAKEKATVEGEWSCARGEFGCFLAQGVCVLERRGALERGGGSNRRKSGNSLCALRMTSPKISSSRASADGSRKTCERMREAASTRRTWRASVWFRV